jgi:hypothetical protein
VGWGGIAWQSQTSGSGDDQRREGERSGVEVDGRAVESGSEDPGGGWIEGADLEWRD